MKGSPTDFPGIPKLVSPKDNMDPKVIKDLQQNNLH